FINKEYDLADNLTNVLKEGAIPHVGDTAPTQQNEKLPAETENTSACRLCAGEEYLKSSIYESLDNERISNMIMLCCHPITITENDGYPSMICSTCLQQLQTSYNFRNKCLEINELWTKRLKQRKRKQDIEDNTTVKKQRAEDTLTVSKDNVATKNITYAVTSALSERSDNEKKKDYTSRIIYKSGNEKHNNEPNYKIQEKVENETSSISKDEIENPATLRKEGGHQTVAYKDNKILLPDGIIVKTQKKFESSTGIYSCTITHGLQESVFVMADGYLFTFGLLKGTTRHLRCVLPNCKAKAEQTLLEKDTYEDKISVKVPHSHKAPNDQLRKKHMFFHVMRKRMQHDKTLNIRSIYEEVCNQEPEIRELVPLRNVINEICKHQVSNKLPRITSFEKFYEKIEDECYEKLHFTNTNKQFYQERFCTDDGCMAIVFCNTDVVENIGQCTLMYVDASFKIDTFEDFKYQLVTVLVWIDDSYYPILYALVNRKTQEIFIKVFQYLHDVLAPNIRPHEIVTDYEANLYYALGETYLESHIGGSVFYYT
ncbi:zinc-finger associated domain containing protein, partial [Oryctes borbonicus]